MPAPALACGGRYDLGQTKTSLLDEPLVSTDQIGVLIIDGPEDADAETELEILRSMGDIDGDGYGDLLTTRMVAYAPFGDTGPSANTRRQILVYGGPRSNDGWFRGAAEGAWSTWNLGSELGILHELTGGGDVDGDGRNDVITTRGLRYESWSLDEMSRQCPDEVWARHQTRLVYGATRRSADDLLATGANFNPEPRVFPRQLAESLARDFAGYHAQQIMSSTALGDINRDGYDDVAITVWFQISGYVVKRDESGAYEETTKVENDVNTYLFYGDPEQFEADAASNPPAARFENVSSLDPIGDVDGDGLIEFIATRGALSEPDRTAILVQGRPGRLAGDVALDNGLVIEGSNVGARSLGDLDGDGYGDFVISDEGEAGKFRSYLFYGDPALTREPLRLEYADASFEMSSTAAVESGEPATTLELMPIGDWTGDGLSDLLLTLHAPTLEHVGQSLVQTGTAVGEARIIVGARERYLGRYAPPDPASAANGRKATGFTPIGDIDGDGLADVAFSARAEGGEARGYIKYGGPLISDVH